MDVGDISDGFRERLKELAEQEPELIAELLRREGDQRGDDRTALGRHLAAAFVAPTRWRRAVGETIHTSELSNVLGCSRQAIKQRVDAGRLLALPGRRSSLYPTCQVNFAAGEIRPAASAWLSAWFAIEPDASPLTLAAWACAPNEELGGRTPAELVVLGEQVDDVVAVAEATAGARAR